MAISTYSWKTEDFGGLILYFTIILFWNAYRGTGKVTQIRWGRGGSPKEILGNLSPGEGRLDRGRHEQQLSPSIFGPPPASWRAPAFCHLQGTCFEVIPPIWTPFLDTFNSFLNTDSINVGNNYHLLGTYSVSGTVLSSSAHLVWPVGCARNGIHFRLEWKTETEAQSIKWLWQMSYV